LKEGDQSSISFDARSHSSCRFLVGECAIPAKQVNILRVKEKSLPKRKTSISFDVAINILRVKENIPAKSYDFW
jgi:hypothetical protein